MEEKALVGMTRAESRTVTEEQLACRVGSGTARVFATPCLAGMTVTVEAVLLETDGRRFTFHVTARDEAGPVGEGTHQRCTVKTARFEEKAAARRPVGE